MPVGQGRNAAGVADIKLGRHGAQLVAAHQGKYAERALEGKLYWTSSVVAGLAIPIDTTTAPTVMLWNPSGSGVDAVLGRFTASQASGTSAGGSIGLMSVSAEKLGSEQATAARITAFADDAYGTNVFSGRLNEGNRPRVKSSSQGTNTITAGTWIRAFGMYFGAAIATSAGNSLVLNHDFDGEVVLPPGSAVYIAANIASVALFQTTFSWYEVPATL